MKRKKGQFRLNAASAKTRLATGFWAREHEKTSLKNIYNIYYGKTDNEDEQLYNIVAGFLNEGINPLSRVLDRALMEGLDDAGRERYVLTMGSKVSKCVERYNQVC